MGERVDQMPSLEQIKLDALNQLLVEFRKLNKQLERGLVLLEHADKVLENFILAASDDKEGITP